MTKVLLASLFGLTAAGAFVVGCASHEVPPNPPPMPSPVADVSLAPPPKATAQPIQVPPAIQAIVEATDRMESDRALDKGRHPGETLAFFGVTPGMKVADISAAGGYTTELLARAVGPTGKVYGQNSKGILEKFAEKPWSERLSRRAMAGVVRVDREFDAPLPPEAKDLDLVVDVLFYHDTYWLKVDRDAMNKAIFAALKPGGRYVILDHSGRPGTGATEVQTLHRIEEKTVREEIERAGFKLETSSDYLRNPDDTRDWNDAPSAAAEKRGTSDRFALKFRKP